MLTKGSLVGQRFGRYFVAADAPTIRRRGQTEPRSLCFCDCGTIKTVRNAHLRSGRVVSCGCHSRERATKHGQAWPTKTKEYSAWSNMLARCLNPAHAAYPDWGGRGITVCERWLSFENFFADLGKCPPKLTLERVHNSLGYSPDNCGWHTRKRQQRNRRTNHIVTVRGLTGCLAELCEHFGAVYYRVLHRLRLGWSPERAFFEPKH